MANIEEQIPNSPEKLFDIASTSKQFTGLYYNSQKKETRNITYKDSKLWLGSRELIA